MKLAFLPNYGPSVAQIVIPAADVSQHISVAGTEASGTSTMKLVMNGAVVVGTMDGASAEICEEAGSLANHFFFGPRKEDIAGILKDAKEGSYQVCDRLERVLEALKEGWFSCGDEAFTKEIGEIVDLISNVKKAGTWAGDKFLIAHDFPLYIEAQDHLNRSYQNRPAFVARSIEAVGNTGNFSSDRTAQDYAEQVWELPSAQVGGLEASTSWHVSFSAKRPQYGSPRRKPASAAAGSVGDAPSRPSRRDCVGETPSARRVMFSDGMIGA